MTATAQKSCDSCTVCCLVPAVPELQKPPNQECKFCVPGVGCDHYGMHPQSCRNFKCMWLKENWDDELRPDRCKVMVETIPGCTSYVALLVPGFDQAWLDTKVQAKFREIQASGCAVIVKPGARKVKVLAPHGVTSRKVMRGLKRAYRRLP